MDFPVVQELCEYWIDFPPDHELLRAIAGYDPKKSKSNWRSRRAEEMGDHTYKPDFNQRQLEDEKEARIKADPLGRGPGTGARHVTAAPAHLQQAFERAKLGKQWEIPGYSEDTN